MAGARLGFDIAILTPHADAPASRVAARTILAPHDDPAALAALAQACGVITFEFENVPAAALERLEALGAPAAPGARALAIAQDRLEEKRFLGEAGIATVGYAALAGPADVAAAFERLGAPLILKTRRGGYDGKGQAWAAGPTQGREALAAIGGRESMAEAACDFRRELAQIAVRGRDGEIALYPLTESFHEGGILRRTIAPAEASREITAQAQAIAGTLLVALDYVGVIGIEMFETMAGALLVNEFAPRVHNTGHWTLDGCEVDQFEQHIRAVAGWPLGPTEAVARVEMTNLLGREADDWRRLAAEPGARVWLYGKGEARPLRKMGHVNRLSALRTVSRRGHTASGPAPRPGGPGGRAERRPSSARRP